MTSRRGGFARHPRALPAGTKVSAYVARQLEAADAAYKTERPTPAAERVRAETAAARGRASTALDGVSHLEAALETQLRMRGVEKPRRDKRFTTTRRWRFDFAWPALWLAAEVEGGTANGQGKHSRGEGFQNDTDKYNAAKELGWQVMTFTAKSVHDESAADTLARMVAKLRAEHIAQGCTRAAAPDYDP